VVANTKLPTHHTSQSPAVKLIDVRFIGVAVVNDIALPEAIVELINSPTLPAAALSLVAVPIIFGAVILGEVAKTLAPVPVSSVIAAIRLALDGVARKVDTLVPRPLTPVLIGRPVQLVSVPEEGVPNTGVVKVGVLKVGVVIVGEVARTIEPVPVLAVTAVPAILKSLLAVSKILLVNVSEVALPTRVSATVGIVAVLTVVKVGVTVVAIVVGVVPVRTILVPADNSADSEVQAT